MTEAVELDILVILDRSGSMQDAKKDHEGGLRSFVEETAKKDPEAKFTLIQFDDHDPCEVIYDRARMASVGDIVLSPRGYTPLRQAIGLATAHLEARTENPNVVCLIITDGDDNRSQHSEWTPARVKARIAHLESRGWTILYLGANVDEFKEAADIGISSAMAMGFDNNSIGTHAVYTATVANVSEAQKLYRSARSLGVRPAAAAASVRSSYGFKTAQRARAKHTYHPTTDTDKDKDNT